MTDTQTAKLQFFVYVVESPSAPDLYHQRSESDLLRRALNLNNIQCVSRCAISRTAFSAALKIGMTEEMERFKGLFPLLHISTHGHSEGLQLSNDEVILWRELADLLVPINRALQSRLVVAMSCCEGYSGVRMAMRADRPDLPFYALVGSPEKPTWAETAVAFTTFYHQLARGVHITDAVNAMRIASGRNSFFVQWGENTRQGYLDYLKDLKDIDVQKVQNDLRDQVETQLPEDTAKMTLLEKGNA